MTTKICKDCPQYKIMKQQIREEERKRADKMWNEFSYWLVETSFPSDFQKMMANILQKTCEYRENLMRGVKDA